MLGRTVSSHIIRLVNGLPVYSTRPCHISGSCRLHLRKTEFSPPTLFSPTRPKKKGFWGVYFLDPGKEVSCSGKLVPMFFLAPSIKIRLCQISEETCLSGGILSLFWAALSLFFCSAVIPISCIINHLQHLLPLCLLRKPLPLEFGDPYWTWGGSDRKTLDAPPAPPDTW